MPATRSHCSTSSPLNDVHFTVNQFGNAKVHSDFSRRSEGGSVGIRLNAAVENQESYVRSPGSNREFISLAADLHISDATLLQIDVEHERRNEVLQPNYTVNTNGRLPDHVDPSRFLGQTWGKYPTQMSIASGKLQHAINDNWSIVAEGNWGRQDREQTSLALTKIQPNGDAGLELFDSPNQKQQFVNSKLTVTGQFATGPFSHQLSIGASSHRFKYSYDDYFYGTLPNTTNIYNPVRFANPNVATGANYLVYRKDERGVFVNDAMSFGEAWKLHVGGRYTQRDTQTYNVDGSRDVHYDKSVFTPSVALLFKPQRNITTYVSYIEGLEDGGTAPNIASNRLQQLQPLTSKQWETGLKLQLNQRLSAEAAIFKIERPAEFINTSGAFVQSGGRVHKGLELSLTGKATQEWTVFASALLLDAKFEETGDASTKGQRPTDTPAYRYAMATEYAPLALHNWTFIGNWSRTGARPTNDNNTSEFADSYNLFGIGARYDTLLKNTPTTVRFYIDNILDKRYWANVSYGALIPGAPRTAMASISLHF